MPPVWTGQYTDSDKIAARLQERILFSNYDKPNSITPVVADELINLIGDQVEADIDQALYSCGYKLPLQLTSTMTQRTLAAVAEKTIICQLLIGNDLKAECACTGSFDEGELEKLCENYCAVLSTFVNGLNNCSIVLEGETKADSPCETPIKRASALPTSIGISTPRSCGWTHPSQIRF